MITPDEVGKNIKLDIAVENAVDSLIMANYDGSSANFNQTDLIMEIRSRSNWTTDEIFAKRLLNFEEAYRANGWDVHYNKPAYNENYIANWTFKRK